MSIINLETCIKIAIKMICTNPRYQMFTEGIKETKYDAWWKKNIRKASPNIMTQIEQSGRKEETGL